MSADQIAAANLELVRAQVWITGLAIVLGPLLGAFFTMWAQGRKERQDAKVRLFTTLLAHRKANPFPYHVVGALNTIDVVFAKSQGVRDAWHKVYAQLMQGPGGEAFVHAWLELLSAMASDLGFKHLNAMDLDKFYMPQGLANMEQQQREILHELHRVLERTSHFLAVKRLDEVEDDAK